MRRGVLKSIAHGNYPDAIGLGVMCDAETFFPFPILAQAFDPPDAIDITLQFYQIRSIFTQTAIKQFDQLHIKEG